MTMQGKLIVFEGGEGSGKTTQIQLTQQWLTHGSWLQQLQLEMSPPKIITTHEPGATELGCQIRQLLLGNILHTPLQDRATLLLFMADRAQHVEQELCPWLAEGALVLCDRYTDSTIAYQGYGQGLEIQLIEQLNQIATGGLTSDLTLWLDLDVEVGLARMQQRGHADRMEQRHLKFHHAVHQGFHALATANPERIVRIDARGSAADVQNQIQAVLSRYLKMWYGQGT
jgi:dTMP kinase